MATSSNPRPPGVPVAAVAMVASRARVVMSVVVCPDAAGGDPVIPAAIDRTSSPPRIV
jgi:hypothetical protein